MTPHGWFAAEYATYLRNMLVREDGTGLTLMSALSPAWLFPGAVVEVRGAPTTHGKVTFRLRVGHSGAHLSWDAAVPAGTKLRWPLPAGASGVRAKGLQRGGHSIVLPARKGELDVHWRMHRGSASFGRAVAKLRAAYRRHGR
jgi:hypothetical protein